VGLAVGVVRNGSLEFFYGHGLADIESNTPITEDTVFRIGSITKIFTAIAVMQLWEQGLIDLDAPANDYLCAYKLIPARASFWPAAVRHLLTHTAGIPEVVYASDLLHPGRGPFFARPAVYSVKVGEPLPSLAEYYHGGLRLVVEPGSAFAYSNHGFATLGQIIEDVSGMPLERYLREHIFEPLGMADSDLVRSDLVTSRLATGYVLGPSGARAVPDREGVDSDLRVRVMMGGGAQVFVRGGQLMVRLLTPMPALYRGLPLHPDHETDPYMFRLDTSKFGMPTVHIVFCHEVGVGTTAVHTDLESQPLSLFKRPATRRPGASFTLALGALAVVSAVRAFRRRSRPYKGV